MCSNLSSENRRVLVAMSGGVDSSVAAALLKRAGYDVIGVFMRLGSPGEEVGVLRADGDPCAPEAAPNIKIGHQGCCSIGDANDARVVASRLGIPFYVCNFKKDFGRVIDYFVDEYANGRTPNPCVRCNDWLKFGTLHRYAEQLGASWVASGHYARIEGEGESARLLRGIDESKDQSYVLFGIPREQLAHTMFPVGGYQKPEIRRMARDFDLPVFDKPDSQEICFVPDNDYASLVERRRSGVARPGDILDENGSVMGEHAGQHHFTIGQRRGLGVARGVPLYVLGKDSGSNTVTIGPRERLMSRTCTAGEANWLVDPRELSTLAAPDQEGPPWFPVLAKHRYNSPPALARAAILPDGTTETHSGRTGRFAVRFDEDQFAITPGQAIVLYDASNSGIVLGGGWIDSIEQAR